MIGWLVNRPNNIRARQIAYQNDPNPTYLKGARRFTFPITTMIVFGSFGYTGYLVIQYIRGKVTFNQNK